jgi:hypothetical protein
MKKRIKIFVIAIVSIALLGVIFGTVDYIRVKNGKPPIFTIHVHTSGNWDKYYGLGYLVVKNDACQGNYTKFGPYFASYACFIESDYVTKIKVVKTANCDNKAKLYYNEGDRKIYTYCLDQIDVYNENKTMSLKNYLEIDSNAVDFIINNFVEDKGEPYNDGGSIMYHGDEFNILKCHTIAGNNDIYIGGKDMGYHCQ